MAGKTKVSRQKTKTRGDKENCAHRKGHTEKKKTLYQLDCEANQVRGQKGYSGVMHLICSSQRRHGIKA